MNAQFDIAIIGGGPVGAALALALRNSKLKACVLEARPADSASSDARALALSYGSRLLLDRLGVWNSLHGISPIRAIHISQKQSFGRAVLRAGELNVPELGYVLPYPSLQDTLTGALQHSDVASIYGASVTQLTNKEDHAVIGYQQDGAERTLHTRLAVVADGGKLLAHQFPPDVHDYGQSALITHITCSAPQTSTAFERFTPQGPLALLPFRNGYELVWTAPHQAAQDMLAWEDAKFLRELHRHFGDRVGEFLSVGKRTCFPLVLRRAPQQSPMPHVVLLGNAAQTMHPVAGQGFNMGLRDAWELAQEILDAKPEQLGTEAMLAAYRSDRRTDREAGIRFTDGLVRLFSNDLPLVSAGRAAALTALDCLPLVKKFVAKRMMFGANG
ncbi:MAG: Ubiquinone biosynthesis hydroxylase, UbiH/UbiF/VisC/COQ6 family [Candidatus Gallionella acididurans]|uniref:Ubiquinone biosynthesis hydroxylase, UbiH/UbiF/VisC/COQ6 family n=1 Tax=Candidatus Gallionella acididurans TaxID=1796491 RepID=A0A139BVT9_9PROT|nr:MAG: Ubiquinone biosynthesis hydroxylase, UbiH/UbiF/VisC/COQ6 family [Candidatus Gallionella acididurans]